MRLKLLDAFGGENGSFIIRLYGWVVGKSISPFG